MSEEGGTAVGDVGNLKIGTFWTFQFFYFFFVGGTSSKIWSGETLWRRQVVKGG